MKILNSSTLKICFAFFIFAIAAITISAQGTNFTSVYKPLPTLKTKGCINDDISLGEGGEYSRMCPGIGNYKMLLYSYGEQLFGIKSRKSDFETDFILLEDGDAEKYVRADLYAHVLDKTVEWRLADGKPFAVIVKVSVYKKRGGKAVITPKNKAAVFYMVRGLKGFEKMNADIKTVNTPFIPIAQAHKLTDEYYDDKKAGNVY